MVKKRKITKIILLSLLLTFGFNRTSEARVIREFYKFKITSSSARTQLVTKSNDSHYVLNLRLSEDLAPMNVKHYLANSNGDARSGVTLLRCGQRGTYSNWAQAGYLYGLSMARENPFDFNAYITGSWSPDTW